MSIFSRQYKGNKTFLNVKVICASFLSTGIYTLELYTVPDVPAMVTISNRADTKDFTTASCSPCPTTNIPP